MNYKLRIKHPSGAEFEAEGPAEFILSEKESFLDRLTPSEKDPAPPGKQKEPGPGQAWNSLIETKNGLIILKYKNPGLKAGEAALLLMAAERQLKGSPGISAIALSKAVKASGYAPGRLDRLLAKAVREGSITASGTKRNRAYQITDKGLETAWLEARKLNGYK